MLFYTCNLNSDVVMYPVVQDFSLEVSLQEEVCAVCEKEYDVLLEPNGVLEFSPSEPVDFCVHGKNLYIHQLNTELGILNNAKITTNFDDESSYAFVAKPDEDDK